nr:amidohydrolase family protein [Bacillota bacterium]
QLFQRYLSDEAFIEAEYEEFQKTLAAKGVTSIKEIGFDDYSGFTRSLKKLEDGKKLLHRVNLVSQPVAKEPDFEYAERCGKEFTGEYVKFMGFNIMVDGEICGGEGDLLEPYANGCTPEEPDYEEIEKTLIKADRLGIRCALHAEGDRAVRRTVDMIEQAAKVNQTAGRRHAIIDLEMTHREDIERMARLGITAINYLQMMNCYPEYEGFYTEYIGEERLKNIWRYKDQAEAGVNYCTGTDLPLDVPDVPASIRFAVGRRFPDGKPEGGFQMGQAFTTAQVLKAWTVNGQYANFEEERLGTLAQGKLADIAVFDRNIFKSSVEDMAEASVILTIFDGKVIYE